MRLMEDITKSKITTKLHKITLKRDASRNGNKNIKKRCNTSTNTM